MSQTPVCDLPAKVTAVVSDVDAIWQARLRAVFGDDFPLDKVNGIESCIRIWTKKDTTFERVLDGQLGWNLGGVIVPLHSLIHLDYEARDLVIYHAIQRSRETRRAEIKRFLARYEDGVCEHDDEPMQPSPILPADTARPETVAAGRAM